VDGRMRLMRTSNDAFITREWLASDADARSESDPSLANGVSCDDAGCTVLSHDSSVVALALKSEAFADDCARAAVMVTALQPPVDCAALTIDQERLKKEGALALRKTAAGTFAVEAIRPPGVSRPWSAAIADAESETASGRRSNARPPIDATPAEADIQVDD
jgi:competence protein ComEC